MPEVSVIVPVYNVKDYLDDCVVSLLNQSFKDFELILVDDGSRDGSLDICEKYAESDSRIKVIKKANGGLSSARNAGIDWAFKNSKSRFFLFVDSDDKVYSHLLENVLSIQKDTDADIVVFGFEMTDDNLKPLSWGHTAEKEVEIFAGSNRFSPLLPPYDFGDYAWNKLYKKDLFFNIRYPNGLNFEDTYTTYKVFDLAEKIVCLPDRLYLYRRRQKSITTTGGAKSKLHYFDAVKQKFSFISSNYSNLSDNATAGLINSVAAILFQIPIRGKKSEYKYLLSDIRLFLVENRDKLVCNTICSTENLEIIKKLIDGIGKYKSYRRRENFKRKTIDFIHSLPERAMLIKRKILNNFKRCLYDS